MNIATQTCRCCGQPLPADIPIKWDQESRTFTANGGSATFTESESRIFRTLWERRRMGGFMSVIDLTAAAWADDPDGGPDDYHTTSVFLVRVRRKLKPLRWTVTSGRHGRPRCNLNLVELPASAA